MSKHHKPLTVADLKLSDEEKKLFLEGCRFLTRDHDDSEQADAQAKEPRQPTKRP